MTTPLLTPSLASAITTGTDVLVVGTVPSDDGVVIHEAGWLLGESAAELTAALRAVGAKGKGEETFRVAAPAGLGVASVLAVGLGDTGKIDAEQVRKSAGAAARALTGVTSAAAVLPDFSAAAIGFMLGAYNFAEFRNKSAPKPEEVPLSSVELLVAGAADARQLQRALLIAEAVATARDFVNTPPGHLFPAEFASRAATLAQAAGITAEVLDEQQLADGGYGGITGVGQGSSRPPRLVRLSYRSGKDNAPKIALVGKGVTFDTGGISIKPAANMEQMTSDMAGAAAVIATTVLAARLGIAADVTATVPIAENMPSATAQRPGDVLTQLDGTTVEVINTDAEGRLILADAIVRACQDEPQFLIDVATLTGAQLVALGTRTPGVMGTDEFRDRVARISREQGEHGWAMPLPAELRADLNSRVADLANVTPHRFGGMLAAGTFLKEFVAEDVQWAHIDIAGPAFNTGSPFGYIGKGGTGVPVRTLIAVLEDIAVSGGPQAVAGGADSETSAGGEGS